jgi:hypothetical protein
VKERQLQRRVSHFKHKRGLSPKSGHQGRHRAR